MPPRSPTTVGMAVETTVISIAAIDRLSNREMTVSGRLVFILGSRCATDVGGAEYPPRTIHLEREEPGEARQLTTALPPARERSPAIPPAAAGRAHRPRPAPAPARPARARRPSCRRARWGSSRPTRHLFRWPRADRWDRDPSPRASGS